MLRSVRRSGRKSRGQYECVITPFFFFQAEDGIRDKLVTGVQTCALPISGEYRALVEKALVSLSPETYEAAVKLANLPDVIRGYEAIKLRNVRRFRDEVRALGF